MTNSKRVIALDVSLMSYSTALDKLISFARSRTTSYACFANVHMIIEACRDKGFADQVNNATFVFADGMPLVKVLGFFYGIKQDRIAGMDMMPDLIKVAEREKLKIFFFGTTPDVLEKIRIRIAAEFPGAQVAGMLSPPFDRSLDDPSYLDAINSSGANLVFVALGCPKQEKWMARNSSRINAVLLGVGGAFPVFAGTASRAPLWMQKMALEWVYRLFQEPGRLFKRYFITNSLFIFLVMKEKMKMVFGKKQ